MLLAVVSIAKKASFYYISLLVSNILFVIARLSLGDIILVSEYSSLLVAVIVRR